MMGINLFSFIPVSEGNHFSEQEQEHEQEHEHEHEQSRLLLPTRWVGSRTRLTRIQPTLSFLHYTRDI